MNRIARTVVALVALLVPPGCDLRWDDDLENHLPIGGEVTYRGVPVRRGTIHLLPVERGRPSASGVIADGQIREVYTRTPGDGVKSGRYRIAITAFDDDFYASVTKRTAAGPDPAEVARAANRLPKLIPVRYNNARESGLTADLAPGRQTLHLDLVD